MTQTYLPGTVRQRIQDLIKERKITQSELAVAIGMSESALSRFLSEKTDKIGDGYIIKTADFLGVSTDFILGQTDFPERRNYDIGELGLSYKAAMTLYTKEVDTDVVNCILENPRFPEITRMISRYFEDTFAEALAGRNTILDVLREYALASGGKGAQDTALMIEAQKISPHEADLEMLRDAVMEMLCDIKAGIQTGTPTTQAMTKEITEVMMCSMDKGQEAIPAMRQIQPEQLAGAYSALTGAAPELGQQFSGLVQNFITGFIDIAQKQGLTSTTTDGADQ